MSLELYLIGINHYDLKGPTRLPKLLKHLQPNYVSLELDQQRAATAENAEKNYLHSTQGLQQLVTTFSHNQQFNPETVARLMPTLFFEYFAARDYCRKQNISLILSDKINPETNSAALQALQYSLSCNPQQLEQQIEKNYDSRKLDFSQIIVAPWIQRDQIAESIIRQLSGKVVHIGGAGHILGSYYNLYQRLRDLNPERIMLNQADYLE